jgi:hypothetical protein
MTEESLEIAEGTTEPTNGQPTPRKESFADKMFRIGGPDVFEEPLGSSEGKGEAPRDKRLHKPRGQSKPPTSPTTASGNESAELAQLKELAERNGVAIEDSRVSTAERVRLREERRATIERVKQFEQEALARIEARHAESSSTVQMVEAAKAALDAGDFQGFAKALGFESWDKLQEDQIERAADPSFHRILELEKERDSEKREKLEREQMEQQRTEQQRQAQARAAEETRYRAGLAQDMSKSRDPLIAALAHDPGVVGAIFNLQKQHYDPRSGRTLTPEEAADFAAPGAPSLRKHMRQLLDRLNRAFGPPVAPPAPAKPARPRSSGVASSRRTRASDDRDWMSYARQRYSEAVMEESSRAERGRGA